MSNKIYIKITIPSRTLYSVSLCVCVIVISCACHLTIYTTSNTLIDVSGKLTDVGTPIILKKPQQSNDSGPVNADKLISLNGNFSMTFFKAVVAFNSLKSAYVCPILC